MRLAIITLITAFAIGIGPSYAADDNADSGTSSPEDTYTCTDPGGEETPFCVCTSLHACNEMAADGVCDRPQGRGVTNDTTCNDTPDVEDTSAVGGCFCTWQPLEGDSDGPFDRSPSLGEDTGGAADTNAPRRNETVPARRGQAPSQESAQEEQEDEETTPTRRDHRN